MPLSLAGNGVRWMPPSIIYKPSYMCYMSQHGTCACKCYALTACLSPTTCALRTIDVRRESCGVSRIGLLTAHHA
eukprot:1116902-Prymnesium_polylepis.1